MSQRNPLKDSKLNQGFLTYLPSEIIITILSRLPIRTIIICKCVCKSWLNLIETHEFVKYHLSTSVPGLVVYQPHLQSESYKFFEFEDGLDLEHHELRCNLVTKFDLPYRGWISGSTNGLLFLENHHLNIDGLYICNPITREFIELRCPKKFVYSYPQDVTYGFGASKITGQHKVVRIFQHYTYNQEKLQRQRVSKSDCHIYTLGRGSWREIAPVVASLVYGNKRTGAFLHGNLHWSVFDLNEAPWISCLDLETELFSIFSTPVSSSEDFLVDVFALGDRLCLCDNTSDDEIVIWLMKEYGVEKSWTKEFVISKSPEFTSYASASYGFVYPIKVFKDGGILIAWEDLYLVYYSRKNGTTRNIDMFERLFYFNAMVHTPSFLSLKSFEMENVSSF